METCILIPPELSIVLLPFGRPGYMLEMGATLWANCALRPGCVLHPDEGQLRLDRLEIFTDLSDKDVRRRYGCFDEVLAVDKREVRHCNWVRFLMATCDMNDVNVVARRTHHKPEFHIVKPIPVNGELKVYFDELSNSSSIDTLASVLPHHLRAPKSILSSPPVESTPTTRKGHHSPLTSKTVAVTVTTTSLSTSSDDVNMSPTDLSVTRKDTSSFTSPSSGFDSPSMHYSNHVTRTGRHADSTTGSISDGVEADRSRSLTASPLSLLQPINLSPVRENIARAERDTGYQLDDCSNDSNSSATSGQHSPDWPMSCNTMDLADPDDEESDINSAQTIGGFTLPSIPLPMMRRKEKTWLPCDVCGKKFDRPSLLKRHMRTHTGEKPHACDVCFKAFSTSSSLNTHRRIHSGEKPHECPICGKRFTASSNLYYHRMTHKKEKPHKCALCSKSFPTPGDLKSHMYVHSGSWPYKCDVCNRGFSKQANLKNHLLLHTGDKPHCCDLCGKKFALLCNLKTHIKMHEEETIGDQERCDTCGQVYITSRQSPPGDSSPTANRCPDCVATSRPPSQRPSSREPNSIATSFSIDSLVGSKDSGNDVISRASPSGDTDDSPSPIDVKSRMMTSRKSGNVVPATHPPPPSLHHSRFPFPPAIAAAHAQYYALAASGVLSPLHYGNSGRYPITWPPKSQQYGI